MAMAATSKNGALEPHIRVKLISNTSQASKYAFRGGWECMWPLKIPQCCGDASSLEQRSILRAMHPLNPHKKHIRLLRGLFLINFMHWCTRLGFLLVSRAPYLLTAIMVGLVVVSGCSPQTGCRPEPQHITYRWKAADLKKTNMAFKHTKNAYK